MNVGNPYENATAAILLRHGAGGAMSEQEIPHERCLTCDQYDILVKELRDRLREVEGKNASAQLTLRRIENALRLEPGALSPQEERYEVETPEMAARTRRPSKLFDPPQGER